MRGEARRLIGRSACALGGRLARVYEAVDQVVRRIAGMPNYRAFVQHCRERHPDRPIPSEREYFEQYLQSRYGGGGNRCC